MNPELMAEYFNQQTAQALAPLASLTVGVLLLLFVELAPNLTKLRPVIFVGSLLSAGYASYTLFQQSLEPVMGGTFAADSTSALWNLIFLASTLVAWLYSRKYYKTSSSFLGEHDVLLLTAPIGMMMMASALDLIVFFVGLELLSIPLYCLASFRRHRSHSVEAGLKYFVLGAFSVGMFLFGAALFYTATGTVSLTELAGAGSEAFSPLAYAGVAFMLGSLLFKLSIVPFHLWVPDVYQGAPTPVTIIMATGTKAAALAFTLRVAVLLPETSVSLVALLAVVTIAIGNLSALVQSNVKRMLAYSGVAHAGTVLLLAAAIRSNGAAWEDSSAAALYYMAAYVFTAGGAFGLLAWLEADGEHFTELKSLKGLASRRPLVAAAMALFMLSLGGIPATGGFLGKWFVFSVAVTNGLTGFAIAGILFSVVALGYYLRVIVAMYMEPAPEDIAPPMAQRAPAAFGTALCAAMVLLLGLLPGLFIN